QIPIATTLLSCVFFFIIFRHWQTKKQAIYLLWWTIGILTYGLGTLTESLTTLFGWNILVFKSWYITGALLGGFPLAQGTVYLLMNKKAAHTLTVITMLYIMTASVFVILSPVNYEMVETSRLTGKALQWKEVRLFSPLINLYSVIFLIGGAIYSAWIYRKAQSSSARMWGNVWIALGAILPGIGGSFTRFGYTEVLYVTELIGLILIFCGYIIIRYDRSVSIHRPQQS
ncbi:MAG TPA: hypothetical protein VNJ07_13460, partial [Chitinophagales bacterium]|nr:hypothetical protein [Chitinophagales bacterium]